MDTIRFPVAVGNDLDRAVAIIRTRLGYDTKVRFNVVRHSGPLTQALPPQVLTKNIVTLHYDTKWNAVCRTPVFYGLLHTLADSDSAASNDIWESDHEA
jgi:hypothetical protein